MAGFFTMPSKKGVEAAQGYLLGRPNEQIPPAEILASNNPRLVIGKRIAS
jgi:hypothetical protein